MLHEDYEYSGGKDDGSFKKAQELLKRRTKSHGTQQVNVFMKKEGVSTIKQPFVMAMTGAMNKMINEYKVTTSELRVVLYIVERMQFGNLFCLNQKNIATDLEISQPMVSKLFSSLKKKGVIVVDHEKNKYINANIFMKGLKHKSDSETLTNLRRASNDGGMYEPVFDQ